MFTSIKRLMLVVAALLALPVQAADFDKRTICVWDIVGRGGPIAQAVEEFNLEAIKWGIEFELVVNSSEKIIVEQFRSKQCDAAFLSELRIRNFVKFTGSLFAVGAMPERKHLELMYQLLASPQMSEKMRVGPFEIAGIAPAGEVYVFVRDKSINSLDKAVGRKIAVLGDDVYQQQMVELIGGTPVSVTEATAGSMFNNGAVDVMPAPAVAYNPLELYKGLEPKGGIINYPLAQISGQLIIWHERFPEGFGQKSREFHFAQFDRVMKEIEIAAKAIDPKWWVNIPEEDKANYEKLMEDVRIEAVKADYWDGEMIKLQRRVRCKFDPTRAECAKPRNVL